MKPLATLLIAALLAPMAFLAMPSLALAYPAEVVSDTSWTHLTDLVKNTLTAVHTATSAAAEYAQYVNTYVLQPLAFVMSGQILQAIAANIIAFIDGVTNGTGEPQFVQNLQGNLQRVGDTQALSFFVQFGKNNNSPFASAITTSLRTGYLQQTSLGGFFAANQCTLQRTSSNINSYLAGNWGQGGIGSWFALTTQSQNNPYMLYNNSQSQLFTQVTGAQSAREQELAWGKGFLSWCGPAASSSAATSVASDPCIQADGTPGMIQTPGSFLADRLNGALDALNFKWDGVGDIGSEFNGIMKDLGTVFQTAGLAGAIVGSASGNGGLYGASQGSGSVYAQYRNSPGYWGITPTAVTQSAAAQNSGADMLSRVSQYQSSWNTIGSAANQASSNVTLLATYCTQQAQLSGDLAFAAAAKAEATLAQSTLSGVIVPVQQQAAQAATIVTNARSLVARIQAEASTNPTAYAADVATLVTAAPTAEDAASAQQQAAPLNSASGSGLAVSAQSLYDQMTRIASNAETLKTSVCTPPSPTPGF